ncbi:MAG: type II secretion system protein, partial [Planctomycetota bacterium]
MKTAARGMTLIEILIATSLLATAAVGVAGSMMAGIASNRIYQQNTLLVARAQHHIETMYNLQIGQDSDPTANQAQMELVFSGDPELGQNPPSLTSICKTINMLPGFFYEFTPPNLGFPGTLLVRVTNNVATDLTYPAAVDVDGDGVPDDGVATMAEGRMTPQFLAAVYESDLSDAGRELFAFEVFYRPSTPAGAAPR